MDATAAAATPGVAAPASGRSFRELSEAEVRIIEFERQWWKFGGAKEQAITETFGLSSTRYYQTLNALLDEPAALELDPMLVKRLRRLRDSRQRARQERRLTGAR